MAFLSDLKGFYGTGEKNRAGQSLEEFLEHYNPAKYESLCNTADIVVVRCEEKLTHWGQPLKVIMVKRSDHPSIGFWATPGGFVELKEDISEGAARELEEETCVKGLPLRQAARSKMAYHHHLLSCFSRRRFKGTGCRRCKRCPVAGY